MKSNESYSEAPKMRTSAPEESVCGKHLLILGGTYASLDAVRAARAMGVTVTVTDDGRTEDRVADISTADIGALAEYVAAQGIDGVFCGPSEFNIRNMAEPCRKTGLPCYTTPEQWDELSNKASLKKYCLRNGVAVARSYGLDSFLNEGDDREVKYPVAVKPVNGSSFAGVTVC